MAGAKPSRLEQLVVTYIRLKYPDLELLERSRAIKKTRSGKSRYEMDIYLPQLKLAFEIQDFATHSRDSAVEKGHPWRRNGLKNGPRLHELKRRLALQQLDVVVFDIWEDDILSGNFKAIVDEQIRGKMNSLNFETIDKSDQ